MLYIIILIYILTLVFIYDINNNKNGKNFNFLFLLIIFICTAGFSYRLGIDSTRYEIMFDNIPSLNESSISIRFLILNYDNYDPLWLLLNSACKTICNEFWLVKLLTAIFVNSTIFWFCRKHSPAPFLTICFYYIFQFWNFNYEILRESISVSFFLLALHNIICGRNNLIRYYIIVIPSIFFHSFGVITLFFPLIKYLKFDRNLKKYILIIAILTPFLFAISGYLMQFDMWGDNLSRKMEDKYLAGNNNYGSGVLNAFGILQEILTICCSFYIIIKSKVTNDILQYGYSYCFIMIMTIGFAILYRLNNYFFLSFCICFSYYILNTLKYTRYKSKNILLAFILITLLLEPKLSYNVYRRYTPYSSIFTKEVNIQREKIYNNF